MRSFAHLGVRRLFRLRTVAQAQPDKAEAGYEQATKDLHCKHSRGAWSSFHRFGPMADRVRMDFVGARRLVVCSRNYCRFTQIIRQKRVTRADLALRSVTSLAAGTCRLNPSPRGRAVRYQPDVVEPAVEC